MIMKNNRLRFARAGSQKEYSLLELKDPQTALVALTMFVGHMLAGMAVEIGVSDDIDAEGVGDAITEIITEQLALMRSRKQPGSMLQ